MSTTKSASADQFVLTKKKLFFKQEILYVVLAFSGGKLAAKFSYAAHITIASSWVSKVFPQDCDCWAMGNCLAFYRIVTTKQCGRESLVTRNKRLKNTYLMMTIM